MQQAGVGLGMGGPVGGDQRLQRGLVAVGEGVHGAGSERAHAAAERPLRGRRRRVPGTWAVSGTARSTSKPTGTSHSKVAGGMLVQAPVDLW